MGSKARVPAKDFNTLFAANNWAPFGLWSDGTTMWVADEDDSKIYAYDLGSKARVPAKDFTNLSTAGNTCALVASGQTAPRCGSQIQVMTNSTPTMRGF